MSGAEKHMEVMDRPASPLPVTLLPEIDERNQRTG